MYKKLIMIIVLLTTMQHSISNNFVMPLQQLESALTSLQQLLQKASQGIEEKIITFEHVQALVDELRIPEDKLFLERRGGTIFFWGSLLAPLSQCRPSQEERVYYDYPQLPEGKDDRATLAGNYKIHLMPKNAEDFKKIIQRLLTLAQKNKFQKSLYTFKVLNNANFNQPSKEAMEKYLLSITRNRGIMPLIVLYPCTGKEHAQAILTLMYNEFKDMKGLDLSPRFNEKVTSLIYFAQGNGDDKVMENRQRYFEPPLFIYYRHTFENSCDEGIYLLDNPTFNQLFKDCIQYIQQNTPGSLLDLSKKLNSFKDYGFSVSRKLNNTTLLEYAQQENKPNAIRILNTVLAKEEAVLNEYLAKYPDKAPYPPLRTPASCNEPLLETIQRGLGQKT